MLTEPVVMLLWYSPHAIDDIAYAARTCYQSHDKATEASDKKLVKGCVRRKHLSVIEHAFASFEIICSRVCTHQLVRHRHFSFAQRSQRYVFENDGEWFYLPPSITDRENIESYENCVMDAHCTYTDLVGRGEKREDARYLLPNATLSNIVMTGNMRTWREFIQKRSVPEAQHEIRVVAAKVYAHLSAEVPEVFTDLEVF